eukprot:212060-Ditylum_brightwellii.AAC.3
MNLLPGSPVTLQNIDNSEFLFEADVGSLKTKTTIKVPELVTSNYIEVLQEIIDLHKDITFTADVLYINKVPFLDQIHDGTEDKQ